MNKHSSTSQAGFTLIELIATVVIMLLLVGSFITWTDNALIQTTKTSRDDERTKDVRAIATEFEQYYLANPLGTGASYPSVSQVNTNLSSLVPNTQILTPPLESSPGLITAGSANAQNPNDNEYIYQPLTVGDGLCTVQPCTKFVLYYRTEVGAEVKTIESRRKQ